jgi:hypothetical protein
MTTMLAGGEITSFIAVGDEDAIRKFCSSHVSMTVPPVHSEVPHPGQEIYHLGAGP